MGRAKEIIVKVIPAKIANEFVKKHHYSGKVATSSTLHFGAFLDDKLHGVVSLGRPMDKSKVLPLVENTGWNEMLELNRLAFDDYLPKNSESRCFSIVVKLLKKNAPHIKWILSYADGCQCGDGSIYRASGFYLTSIKVNKGLFKMPNGEVVATVTLSAGAGRGKATMKRHGKSGIYESWGVTKFVNHVGAKTLDGFQLRYIYLIDKTCKITVPILPFSKIDELGAGMYKGKKVSLAERQLQAQLPHKGEGQALQPEGAFDSTAALNKTV